MNKEEFLGELRKGLQGLPKEEVEGRLEFYSELIDDRTEEGMSESEAVEGIGPVSDIVAQTVAEVPLTKIVKERMSPGRSMRAWEIVLLVLGFPLWFPLLIAALAVILSLYIVLWSLVIALWAVEISLVVSAVGGIAVAVIYFVKGYILAGLAMLGAALICAGLSILMFFACVAVAKGVALLAKKIAVGIKSLFIRKGKSK